MMMGKGNVEETRPEHENQALTPSHDGCLQVKMDAPAGLQRPSEGRPSQPARARVIGRRVGYCR